MAASSNQLQEIITLPMQTLLSAQAERYDKDLLPQHSSMESLRHKRQMTTRLGHNLKLIRQTRVPVRLSECWKFLRSSQQQNYNPLIQFIEVQWVISTFECKKTDYLCWNLLVVVPSTVFTSILLAAI
jgi:hypothetical protein